MEPRQKEIHSLLRSMLNVLGRDDLTVTDISEEDGTVLFTLAEGRAKWTHQIPSALPGDRRELSRRLNDMLQAEHAGHLEGRSSG